MFRAWFNRAWFNTHSWLTGAAVVVAVAPVAVAVAQVVPAGVVPAGVAQVVPVGVAIGVAVALAWTGGPLPPASWAYVFESVWYWSPDIGTGSQQWNALALEGENPALTASAVASTPPASPPGTAADQKQSQEVAATAAPRRGHIAPLSAVNSVVAENAALPCGATNSVRLDQLQPSAIPFISGMAVTSRALVHIWIPLYKIGQG
jgi:hypothetical protein